MNHQSEYRETIVSEQSLTDFCFQFGEDECHKMKYEVCSLDLSYESKASERHERCDEYEPEYCQRLLSELTVDGQSSPIWMRKNTCGHFDFSDGRHRACIAARRKLTLYGYLISNGGDSLCPDCCAKRNQPRWASLIEIIKNFFLNRR